LTTIGSPRISGIGGIVFDLDGVLIRSSEWHRQAFEEVLAPFGIVDFDYERYAGWRTVDVFRHCLSRKGTEPVVDEVLTDCSRRKSARARELVANSDAIAPGCVPALLLLSKTFKLALASSGSRASVEAFLTATRLHAVFGCVLSGDDVAHAKPDPELFERSMAELRLPPARCAVVEDAVAGVQAGRAAGAIVIGFGRERTVELTGAGAVAVVDSLDELTRLLI
jgi:HAD superfamily hydrolase (TIGR01509 family)